MPSTFTGSCYLHQFCPDFTNDPATRAKHHGNSVRMGQEDVKTEANGVVEEVWSSWNPPVVDMVDEVVIRAQHRPGQPGLAQVDVHGPHTGKGACTDRRAGGRENRKRGQLVVNILFCSVVHDSTKFKPTLSHPHHLQNRYSNCHQRHHQSSINNCDTNLKLSMNPPIITESTHGMGMRNWNTTKGMPWEAPSMASNANPVQMLISSWVW